LKNLGKFESKDKEFKARRDEAEFAITQFFGDGSSNHEEFKKIEFGTTIACVGDDFSISNAKGMFQAGKRKAIALLTQIRLEIEK
jgi:hypothetical protein